MGAIVTGQEARRIPLEEDSVVFELEQEVFYGRNRREDSRERTRWKEKSGRRTFRLQGLHDNLGGIIVSVWAGSQFVAYVLLSRQFVLFLASASIPSRCVDEIFTVLVCQQWHSIFGRCETNLDSGSLTDFSTACSVLSQSLSSVILCCARTSCSLPTRRCVRTFPSGSLLTNHQGACHHERRCIDSVQSV